MHLARLSQLPPAVLGDQSQCDRRMNVDPDTMSFLLSVVTDTLAKASPVGGLLMSPVWELLGKMSPCTDYWHFCGRVNPACCVGEERLDTRKEHPTDKNYVILQFEASSSSKSFI